MLLCLIHAFVPCRTASLYATQLPRQDDVELVQMLLSPLDTRTHHERGETLLIDANGVLHEGEVNERHLENVVT